MILNVFRLNTEKSKNIVGFNYKGVKVNITQSPTSDIDVIDFNQFSLPVDEDGLEDFIKRVKNHRFYEFICDNPTIPKVFNYYHEYIHIEIYEKIIEVLCEILNTSHRKLIIYDTRLFNSPNAIKTPLENRIKQFDFFDWCINPDVLLIPKSRIKKFTSLMNKVNTERLIVFDRIIKHYDDDVVKLRNENTISFRNVTHITDFLDKYKNEPEYRKFVPLLFYKGFSELTAEELEVVRVDNMKIYDFSDKIKDSESSPKILDELNNLFLPNPKTSDLIPSEDGTLLHNKDFFNKIDLPWVLDYEDIHDDALKFFKTLDIYSTSYFSIVADSYNSNVKEDTSFTEKLLNPMIVGNLPFLANLSIYYDFFEEVGFDFSYLKDLFGIDYKNMNTMDEVCDNIGKFISYFKNNSLDKVKEDYNRFKHIADSNQRILKQIWIDKIPTDSEWEYLNQLKQEKHISI